MTLTATVPPPAPLGANWGWTLNGVATTSGSDLQLSSVGNRHTAGSALFAIPQTSDGLQVTFTTLMGGGSGGGGIALILADPTQTGPAVVGASGGFGFSGVPGTAVILSTERDNTVGSSNFVGVAVSGVAAPTPPVYVATSTGIPSLRTGLHTWTVTVTGSLLAVTCDGTEVLTANVALGASVLIGFSGSTTNSDDNHLVRAVTVSSATSAAAHEFAVEAYGAVGDAVTDDTAAVNAAVAAAFAYAQANHGYAEVVFQPTTYLIAGNPVTGGATNGSAQIPLPVVAETAEKVILVLRGTVDQSALYHWNQTTSQRAGTVLLSTYNGGDTLPTTGEVSVIGGPTPHFKGDPPSTWDNLLVVVDGIGIELAHPANMCGFDFRCVAEANVPNAAVLGSRTGTGAPAVPAANWGFGLAMPVVNNNDNCNIGYYSVEGLVYGLIVYEHVQAESIRIINCFDGLVCWSSSGSPHRNHVDYASIEGCQRCIVLAGGFNKLDIDVADLEWGGSFIIDDVGTTPAVGRIGLCSNGASGASLNTALNTAPTNVNVTGGSLALEITNLDQTLGPATPPAVPATTVALANPFWRTAQIHITGGTVTQVAIDGVNQLSTSGAFTLPSGHTITLTYSAAPTWAWTLTA